MNERADVRAEDLMSREVTTVAPDDTIEAALALLEESGFSGAPVVRHGKLVGVLSLSDVSRTGHLEGDQVRTRRDFALSDALGEEGEDDDPEEVFFAKRDYSSALLGDRLVQEWMSPEVVSVPPRATLQELCRAMAERHIHRVFVTEGGKLLGVVSSFDVVRHVAGETNPAPRAGSRASGGRSGGKA